MKWFQRKARTEKSLTRLGGQTALRASGVIRECFADKPEESIKEWVEDLQQGIRKAHKVELSLKPEELKSRYPEHAKLRALRPQFILLQGFMDYLSDDAGLFARINEFEKERLCGDFLGVDIVEYRREHGEMAK